MYININQTYNRDRSTVGKERREQGRSPCLVRAAVVGREWLLARSAWCPQQRHNNHRHRGNEHAHPQQQSYVHCFPFEDMEDTG